MNHSIHTFGPKYFYFFSPVKPISFQLVNQIQMVHFDIVYLSYGKALIGNQRPKKYLLIFIDLSHDTRQVLSNQPNHSIHAIRP